MTSVRESAARRGFTLIELGVSLAVVALLIAVVVPSIETVTGVRARQAAGEIAALVRYLYDHAALTGRACRIVFDMDQRSYWGECTSDRFVLDSQKVRARDGRAVIEEKIRKDRPRLDSRDSKDEVAAERDRIEKDAEFQAYTDSEVGKKVLPDSVTLQAWTGHQVDRFSKGTAFLYFFPQGYTERAQIYLESAGDTYTLVVSPLTGQCKVVPEELDLPRDAS